MKFPMRIYLKEYLPVYSEEGWRWRSLCIVYCNESLGIIERLLQRCDMEYKSESVEQRFLSDEGEQLSGIPE